MTKRKVILQNNPPEFVLQQGLAHIDAAETLFDSSPEYLDSAGYLAQLGIELMLKSWCLFLHDAAPEEHELAKLVQSINRNSKELDLENSFLENLNTISTFYNLRYADKECATEIGTEDLSVVHNAAEYIWDRMPPSIIEAWKNIPAQVRGHRVLMRKPK